MRKNPAGLRRRLVAMGSVATLLLLSAGSVGASENRMLGRQSHNTGLPVLPAPGKVVIDGNLSDWDLSARIWSFADVEIRDQYSVETAAMWDSEALYIAAIWRDPTPMRSVVDPEINPHYGWRSDAMQLRISSDKTFWLTTWFFSEKQQPVLWIETWENPRNAREGTDTEVLKAEPGGTDLGRGVQIAYRKNENGLGFVQEMRIPWDLIYETVPDLVPGLSFHLGLEFLWGDMHEGAGHPVHRYADNLQPGTTSREFFWNNWRAWGPAVLEEEGGMEPFRYVALDWQLEGVVPLRLTLPGEARRFTVVIDDASGRRVRSLGADLTPSDYLVEVREGKQIVEVPWDAMDDDEQFVGTGTYTVRGLSHEGLRAGYDTTYYNPGTPPWQTVNPASGWLADHTSPDAVAAGGDWVFVGSRTAEGGSGIIGLGEDGLKKWGERRGATSLAANEQFVYAVAHTMKGVGTLWRYSHDGEYRPFVHDGKERTFDFELESLLGRVGSTTGLAADDEWLALGLSPLEEGNEPQVILLDADSAEMIKAFPLPDSPVSLTFGRGALFVVMGDAVHQMDLETGALKAVTLNGVETPRALTMDAEDNLLVYDAGEDLQVKAFSPSGNLVYTVGAKGGRSAHGTFDKQGMRNVCAIAEDRRGRVWTVERSNDPRRVSVWNRDGTLHRDYIGNTQYAGTGSYLHPEDPDLGYVGSVEMKLDRESGEYEVSRILWSPNPDRNEAFPLWSRTHWFSNPVFLDSDASGKKQRYLYFAGPYANYVAFYMEREGSWIPVAALTTVEELQRQLPQLDLSEHDPSDSVFWNDTNRDGAVSLDECEIVPEKISFQGYWGTRPGSDLRLYTSGPRGITRHTPVGFDDDGAPRFGPAGVETLKVPARGDFLPLPEENQVLVLNLNRRLNDGVFAIDADGKEILWRWPSRYPGVHGSHNAPMSRPGLLIGGLKFLGEAKVNGGVGTVTVVRGNLGQDYYFTTDGLMIGSMFQDARLPSPPLPDEMSETEDLPLENHTLGGEPFSGWFGRQSDGAFRKLTSHARQGAMVVEVRGLEAIERFEGPTVEITQEILAEAVEQQTTPDPTTESPEYVVTRLGAPLPITTEKDEQWDAIPEASIRSPASPYFGAFQIAYDSEQLYLSMEVQDSSPWKNSGREVANLFKTGDAIDLQIGPVEPADRNAPVAGDMRILVAPFGNADVAVLMRPVDSDAPVDRRHLYSSPVHDREFDRVEKLESAEIAVETEQDRYIVRVAVPWADIGIKIEPGEKLRADVGFISSDTAGRINTARTYWSNKATNLVNDEPSEAWLYPDRWGTLIFQE